MTDQNTGGSSTPPERPAGSRRASERPETAKKTAAQPLIKNPPAGNAGERKRPAPPPPPRGNSRLMSTGQRNRYQADLQRQRMLGFTAVGVIILIVLVLAVGIFQSTIGPNIQNLASFNGRNITTGDYYKFRKLTIFKELGRLSSLAQSLGGDTAQQIQSRIQLLQAELSDITKAPVDQPTLENMVGLYVAEKAAKDQYNITVSDDEVNNYLKNQAPDFALYTPTPNATSVPQTATAGALDTAAAAIATSTASNTTPLPTATAVPATATAGVTATIVANATATAATNVTATALATAGITPTPTVSGTPQPTATNSPAPTNTPLAAERAQATVDTRRSTFLDSLKKVTGLSEDDYKQLEVRPTLLKRKVSDILLGSLPKEGDPYPQLRASHIVTSTEEGARDILAQLKAVPQDQLATTFYNTARDKTTNVLDQPRGGDRGWFIDGTFATNGGDDDFWKAANALQVGQLSDPPIKTADGWEVIYLTGRDDKRPLDATEIKTLRSTDQNGDYVVYVKWLKQKVTDSKVAYNTSPTPAPTATQVAPPVFTPAIPPTPTPDATQQAQTDATSTALAAPSGQASPSTTGGVVGPVAITTPAGTTTPGATTAASGTPSGTTTAGTTATGTVAGTATVRPTTAAGTTTPALTPSVGATLPPAPSPAPTR